jgi:hypothetical protein
MRNQVWQLFCLIVFGWFFINATPYLDSTTGSFITKAVAVTDNDRWQCGREETTKTINITCPPYSAMPDDNRDASKAFQAAVDALPPFGGAIVIPPGTYVFHNPLVIHKPVHLMGAGATTILTHSKDLGTNGSANFIRIGGAPAVTEDVTISDLTLQGPQGKDVRTPMIRIAGNVNSVKIHNLLFRNVSSTCILLAGGNNIQNINIADNRADEFYEQFVELGSGGISNVRIERNIAKSTRGHPKLRSTKPFGVVFELSNPGEITDISIVGNHISFDGMSKTELINTGGISLSTGTRLAVSYLYRRIFIQDNIIRTVGVGIRVQTLRMGRVSGPGSAVITKNRIEGATAHGIQVTPAGDDVHRDTVSITENTIRGYSAQAYYQYDGIHLEGSAVGLEIRGNHILPVEGKAGHGRYGISIGPAIKDAVIRDNEIAGYRIEAIVNKGLSGKRVDK